MQALFINRMFEKNEISPSNVSNNSFHSIYEFMYDFELRDEFDCFFKKKLLSPLISTLMNRS